MDQIVKIYNKVAPEISKVYKQQSHIIGIDNFCKTLKPGSRILDLGCGMGKDISIFSAKGFEAVGVDGSVGMIKQARRRYPNEKFFVMDVRRLKLPDSYFDAVWSWSVLTHLSNQDKKTVLTEVNRVLKKNGTFSQMVWRGRGLFINKDVYPRPHHLLSTSSWRKLYNETGFVDLETKIIKSRTRDSLRLTAKKLFPQAP